MRQRTVGPMLVYYNHGMKFSVKNLLAFTLLAALTINGCNTLYQVQNLRDQKSELQNRLPRTRSAAYNFDDQKLILNRAFDTAAQRKIDFEKHFDSFETVAQRTSQLNIADPSKIYHVSIPTQKSASGFRDRFRIYLPDSHQFHLQLSTEPDKGIASLPRQSKLFELDVAELSPIDPGESEITIEWLENTKQSKIHLFVNDKLVREIYPNFALKNNSRFSINRSTQSERGTESCYLFGASFSEKGREDEAAETFLLRLIVSKQVKDRQSE